MVSRRQVKQIWVATRGGIQTWTETENLQDKTGSNAFKTKPSRVGTESEKMESGLSYVLYLSLFLL